MDKEKLEVKDLNEKALEQVSAGGPPTEDNSPAPKQRCPLNQGNRRCNQLSKSACPNPAKDHLICKYD